MADEMEIYRGGSVPDIYIARAPELVIEEARKAAKVLVDVVSQKKNKVMMNGEQYLEFEDWQTVIRFYGCTVKVRSTAFIDYGGVKGFEATADLLDRDGRVISSADAMCLNDEDKWSTRTKYKYEDVLDDKGKKIWVEGKAGQKGYYKSNKVADGEVAVPLFQLRSMAQTRACAKVARNVFSYVVVLAGYKPTVAEELDEAQGKEEKANIQAPQEKGKGTPGVEEKTTDPSLATEPQHRKIRALLSGLGYKKDEEVHNVVGSFLNVKCETLSTITKNQASQLIDHLEKTAKEQAQG